MAASLGIKELAFFGDITQAGNVGAGLVATASAAIASGLAECIVIYRGMNGRSGRRYGRGEVTGRGGAGASQFTEPFGVLVPQHGLAMMTRRRMYETGVTSLQFGATAVAIRQHANRNPRAFFYETPLTMEDHQNSRWVVEPLHLFDCCLENDGAGALVLVSAERREDAEEAARVRARRDDERLQQEPPLRRHRRYLDRPTAVQDGRDVAHGRRRGPDLRPLLPVRDLRAGGLRLHQARRRRRVRRGRREFVARRLVAGEHVRRPPVGGLHAGHEPADRGRAPGARRIDVAGQGRRTSHSSIPASARAPSLLTREP